ncbi:MAG: peptidase [Nitrosopumilus sp.]
MLDIKYFSLLIIPLTILFTPVVDVAASSNPNLFVSAENSQFNNHFSGSMVIEVVIRDPNLHDTDEGKGEPDVTLNGKTLRMVQATDGNWYAYFANLEKAQLADATVVLDGLGLDFGTFCDRDNTIFGIDLSDTDGFFVPSSDCTGVLISDMNNVVRKSKSINTNPAILPGQIGLDPDGWPLIQLFSFSDVTIQYNAAGGTQKIDLEYDEIPNITVIFDREFFPQNSEVFMSVNDFQLNQDPTDEDSWTFNIASPIATFYQAFDSNGQRSAASTVGLVDLVPHLSNLGFKDNAKLSIDLDSVLKLKSNSDQNNETSLDDGLPPPNDYSQIVTIVEKGPNSGIFENFDSNDQSNIGITQNAPRGKTGIINYNEESVSILTGFSTASVSLQKPELKVEGISGSLLPGTEYLITLIDPDQNFNSGSRDDLNVFRDLSIVPTLDIGNPVTLVKSSNVIFYPDSTNFLGGENVQSFVPDKNSARLFIDTLTNNLSGTIFKQISLNLGIDASEIQSVLIDVNNSGDVGTNWINYDFRSLENDFGIKDFSDTRIDLYFDSLSSVPVTIVSPGDISSSRGFVQLDENSVENLNKENGSAFLVINFGSSNTITISNESRLQPIIFDLFSFGLDEKLNGINNSIYRFELEETSDNSSIFEGTFEYAVANQLNILDTNFIKTISTIDDDIKFFITDRLIDETGIFVSYSDLDKVGLITTTSTGSDISTHSGIISTDSTSYRFGQPVVVYLNDLDLNLKSDRIDVYQVIDDINSPNIDTVGKNGVKLLEILLKDVRYKRCTINGVEHGGLASTGFALIETGPSTGIFEGVFKMPSQICNKSGTQLISPAGGSVEIKYHDSRDEFGTSSILSSLNNRQQSMSVFQYPQLSITKIPLPSSSSVSEVILSGSVDNPIPGTPILMSLTLPNGKIQEFNASITSNGNYKSVLSVNSNSLPGTYKIDLEYAKNPIGSVSFDVLSENIPSWVRDSAKQWSSSTMSDSEFINGIKYLLEDDVIIPSSEQSSERLIPSWIKNSTKWWTENEISDEDYIQLIQYLVKKNIILI